MPVYSRTMPILPFALAALLVASPADSAKKQAPPPPPPATIAELEARITQVLDSTHTPGIALAIVRHDSVSSAGGLGKSRVSPARAASDTTLFRIGSTSKAFVALTAVALEREGKLSLQDPVKKYLPDFHLVNPWDATDPIRIVNLLEHTAGFDDNSLHSYASSDPTPLTLAQGLALDTIARRARWRPGTRFSYSNLGPPVVALIIEKIEGKPFEQVVQERWFTPIGMKTATYFRPDTTRFDAVTLYHDDGVTPYPYWYVFVRPAGSINASARDMAQYLRFLLGRGTIHGDTLLPRAAIERMERSETWLGARAGLTIGYGLHLYRVADTLGFVWTGHNGGVEGGLCDLSYLPAYGVGYAYQINTANAKAEEAITGLVRAFVTRGLTTGLEPPRAAIPADISRAFDGWYRYVAPRQQHFDFLLRLLTLVRFSFTDTALIVSPLFGSAHPYLAVDSVHYRRPGQVTASLVLVRDDANGRPIGFESFTSGLAGSGKHVAGAMVLADIGLTVAWCCAVLVALVVGVFGGVRWIVRRVRGAAAAPSAAQPLWRMAILGSLLIVLNLGCAVAAASSLQAIGELTGASVTIYVAGLLFAMVAAAGLVFVVRARPAATTGARASLAIARVVLVLNAIAAAYLLYWGYIGYRTWV